MKPLSWSRGGDAVDRRRMQAFVADLRARTNEWARSSSSVVLPPDFASRYQAELRSIVLATLHEHALDQELSMDIQVSGYDQGRVKVQFLPVGIAAGDFIWASTLPAKPPASQIRAFNPIWSESE